jgi:hypothetical protein
MGKADENVPTRSEIVTGSLATLVGTGWSCGSGEVVGVVVFASPSEAGDRGESADVDAVDGGTEVGGEGDVAAGMRGGTSSFFFGRNAALMSPIPTKNSSAGGANCQQEESEGDDGKGKVREKDVEVRGQTTHRE